VGPILRPGLLDFIVLTMATNRGDYMSKLEQLTSMDDIGRTSTHIAARMATEDSRVDV